MKIDFKIHGFLHIIKSVIGNIEFITTKLSLQKNTLYVVNYHGTQKKFLENFKKQLDFFRKYFEIISPTEFHDFYEGKLNNINKPFLLISFDDGIKNNRNAVKILEEYHLKCFFFIVPDFVNTMQELQEQFFKKSIRSRINNNIDSVPEDFQSFSWQELKAILSNGHAIGSHTQTHTLIAEASSAVNSEMEIVWSKQKIAEGLNVPVSLINSFCSNHNTLRSVGIKEFALIKANYHYHFTTLPGTNRPTDSKLFIKRINIESYWLSGAVKFALGKWGLRRWRFATAVYTQIMGSSNLNY